MTPTQRHTIRASEIRTRLNEIANLPADDLTDEIRAEEPTLQAEYRDVEAQLRAAIAAEETETRSETRPAEIDAEERERRELAARVGTAPFVAAAAQGLAVTGEARELSDAYGAKGSMPLSLLGNVDRAAGIEARAVTPGVNEDGTDMTAPYIFERTVCERLVPGCIRMVPTAAYHSVTLTTAPTAGLLDKSADALNTAGALSLVTRRPVRIAGQAEFQIEDAAVLGDIESTLNGALTALIASQVDEAIITGKAASPDYNGLFDITTNVDRPTADQAFGAVKSAVVTHVDGRYAYGPMDLRAAIGSATYGLMEGLYQSNGDDSVYDVLMRKLGMLAVSDRMPAPTNSAKSQKGLIVLGAGGGPPRVEVPVWNRLDLIRDQYTGAKKGVVTLTATALLGAPVVRYGTDVLKEQSTWGGSWCRCPGPSRPSCRSTRSRSTRCRSCPAGRTCRAWC